MANLKLLVFDKGTGRLRIGIPRPAEFVEGIDLLVQIVTLEFLNNGGRSIFNPGVGGGLRQYIGQNFDPEDPSELFADLALMTSRVEQSIKQKQVGLGRGPAERLQSLNLLDIVPDDEQPEIEIIISVVNEEQEQQQAIVTV